MKAIVMKSRKEHKSELFREVQKVLFKQNYSMKLRSKLKPNGKTSKYELRLEDLKLEDMPREGFRK